MELGKRPKGVVYQLQWNQEEEGLPQSEKRLQKRKYDVSF